MFIGAVKWFDNQKGFGIVALPDEETLFLHIRSFSSVPTTVDRGNVIIGEKRPNKKKEGFIGHHCHFATDIKDWEIVLSLLQQPNPVNVILPTSYQNKKGFQKKTDQPYNLLLLASKQILRGKGIEEIYQLVTQYFEQSLPSEFFLKYAQLIERLLKELFPPSDFQQLLTRIFQFFGEALNHEILFQVWKSGRFSYIGYEGDGDFEIPQEILYLYATEIGQQELVRIKAYSFGPAFCADLIEAQIDSLDLSNEQEINIARSFIDILEGPEKIRWENYISDSLART